ncbi:multidrug transporter MdtH, partial [Aeromonas dhakensis]
VGGGALHDYAMAQGQPWLPWLVLGTVGVTTLLLLANCFHRESNLARVNV